MRRLGTATALLALLLCTAANAADCSVTSIGIDPLYPSIFVPRTTEEESAGLAAVNSIPAGPTVMLSIGMSNAKGLWNTFLRDAAEDPVKNPDVQVVNGAEGGGATSNWAIEGLGLTWGELDENLENAGVTKADVSVIWFMTHNAVTSTNTPEAYSAALENDIRAALDLFVVEFPNLKVVWLQPMIYAGYSTTSGNYEPYAYESGVVAQRILLDQNWSFFVGYGPYMWADGTVPRDDGLIWLCDDFADDGNHPGRGAKKKASAYLTQFFHEDSVARIGYLDPAALVTTPDVVGLDQATAESSIVAAALVVGTVSTDYSDTVPVGNVISQSPLAGTQVVTGTAVDLLVSLGPDEVVVPDVVDLDQATAEASIVSSGLLPGVVSSANSDAVLTGNVISQHPVGGSLVAAGTTVDLVISLGPFPSVPDVVDLDQATAEASIVSAGLVVGAVSSLNSDTIVAGNVISQAPAGGAQVATGTAVDLVISLGPFLTVPDVVDLDQAAAEASILAEGLLVGAVSTANSDTVPVGIVISQNPVGGTQVATGTSVDIVVSLGPFPTVPDVVNLDQAAAEATIVAAGLSVGVVSTANSDTIVAGNVISQSPIGGTQVATGAAVDLVVSIGPVQVTVPDVVDVDQASAEAAIVSAALVVGIVSTANSDTVPADNVISQNPVGGAQVVIGTAVDLVVSLGPVQVTVPDVVDVDQATAEASIVSASLVIGAVSTANSDTVVVSNVISQDPAGGSLVSEGTAVDLVVSLGPFPTVPDVVDLDQATAEASIVSAGLLVGTVTAVNSDTVAVGIVISQTPAGGTQVATGTAVDIVVSLGPFPIVPDVVDLDQATAEASIVAAGLVVGVVSTAVSDTVVAGNVISQSPVGGSVVASGTAVDLVVSLGPVQVSVPDVLDLDQATAEGSIVSAGLTVGTVSTANSDTVVAGNVISQNPVGGSLVGEGTAVDLVVSLGPVQLTVPDVVDLDQATAEASIVAAGLVVGTVSTANSDTVAAGSVISQDPAGGSMVGAGTAVDLIVSLGPTSGVPMIVAPVDGSTLSGSSETFTWSAEGAAVTNWRLQVGSTPGARDIFGRRYDSSVTSELVTGLPTDGSTVYVTLVWTTDGVTTEANYTYTASGDPPPPGATPLITSPVPGSTLSGDSETFTWSAEGEDVNRWRLEVGTTPDGTDLFLQNFEAAITSTVVGGLPTDGSLVYINLRWRIGSVTSVASYVYTASGP